MSVPTAKYTSPSGTVANKTDNNLQHEGSVTLKKNIVPPTANAIKSPVPSKNSDSLQSNTNRPLTALAIQRSDEITARRHSLKQSIVATDSAHALKLLILSLGKPNSPDNMVSLDMFKSLAQKKELLSKAVSLHDGNVILRVNFNLYYTIRLFIKLSLPGCSIFKFHYAI